MKVKSLFLIIIIALLISGCTNQEQSPENLVISGSDKGSYAVALPFQPSRLRYFHNAKDYVQIGQGMIEYSKDYFGVENHILQEGTILKDYNDDMLALINRQSEANPTGLNPTSDTVFDTGNGTTATGPQIITDLFEINFMDTTNTNNIKGITLTLVVRSQTKDVNGNDITIASDKLYDFATNAGRKLESHFRNLPKVMDLPILIMLYDASSSDQTLPGKFLGKGYFLPRSGQFEAIDETWTIIPSTAASELDKTLVAQFNEMKRSLQGFIPENLGIVARAQYLDGIAQKVKITVTISSKTYTEIYVLTEYIMSLAQSFSQEVTLIIEIKNFKDTVVVMRREAGNDTITKVVMD